MNTTIRINAANMTRLAEIAGYASQQGLDIEDAIIALVDKGLSSL